mmetsp:Transcript_121428/g.241876  ORF Transcript_121428/g.241876 Transcript_121428/m.241876 type:complete len:123 (+) Transcript_121428:145-513(+)
MSGSLVCGRHTVNMNGRENICMSTPKLFGLGIPVPLVEGLVGDTLTSVGAREGGGAQVDAVWHRGNSIGDVFLLLRVPARLGALSPPSFRNKAEESGCATTIVGGATLRGARRGWTSCHISR